MNEQQLGLNHCDARIEDSPQTAVSMRGPSGSETLIFVMKNKHRVAVQTLQHCFCSVRDIITIIKPQHLCEHALTEAFVKDASSSASTT